MAAAHATRKSPVDVKKEKRGKERKKERMKEKDEGPVKLGEIYFRQAIVKGFARLFLPWANVCIV